VSHHLLLAYDFPPLGGGIARALGEVCRHYPARSLTVSTGTLPGAEAVDAGLPNAVDRVGVPAERLRTLSGLVRWSGRASRLAASRQASFVWCGNLRPAGYVASWLALRRGLPYGLVVYGLDLALLERQGSRSLRKRLVGRRILGGAAGIVAVSRWTARRLERCGDSLGLGRRRPPVRVIPLGADPERFRPGLETGTIRARYGLEGGPWLLTVSRLLPHKGIDVALEVVARLSDQWPGLHYAVAGTGPDASRLATLAERLGVADRVRWLGAVPDRDLPGLYNVATAYLGLSREEGEQVEGFGLAPVEAQACAVPVLAGASGGVPDAVADGESGLLVSATDPAAAAQALGRLLAQPALARTLGQAGRARVERWLNWSRVAGEWRSAAQAWSGGPGPPGGR
jgi:phosphatidylinositol alpha-1,6-mannosyltransferase